MTTHTTIPGQITDKQEAAINSAIKHGVKLGIPEFLAGVIYEEMVKQVASAKDGINLTGVLRLPRRENMVDYLYGCLVWSDTLQGFDFWHSMVLDILQISDRKLYPFN